MFDARSILDMLVRGGGQPPGSGSGQGADVFRDLLGQLGGGQGGNAQPPPQGRITPNDQQTAPRGGYQDDRADTPPPGQTSGGSLEDLLRSVLGGGEQRGQPPGGGQAGPGGGGLEDLLRSVLGGSAASFSLPSRSERIAMRIGTPRDACLKYKLRGSSSRSAEISSRRGKGCITIASRSDAAAIASSPSFM